MPSCDRRYDRLQQKDKRTGDIILSSSFILSMSQKEKAKEKEKRKVSVDGECYFQRKITAIIRIIDHWNNLADDCNL
jgi:hypothetical protein